MKKADLHIHTTISDGRLTPAQIVREASLRNLGIISITDHDTVDGIPEAKKIADEVGIDIIPGVEITVDFNGKECHVLMYGFQYDNPRIRKFLKEQQKIRVYRAQKIVGNLKKLGFDISFDEVLARAGLSASIARPHIASVMVEKGYAGNTREVFLRYLGNNRPAYFKCEYRSVADVAELAQDAGGVLMLAHPGVYYSEKDLQVMLDAGIDGVEYVHPSHPYELQKKYHNWADKHDLLISGGSDYHGFRYDDECNFGIVAVSLREAQRIRDAAFQRQDAVIVTDENNV
ncbi:MAG TPA: PHP domain-containing protein [Balneolales bacterium]|nr:PHP domain-containing protein [Balneolales bacterium]